MPFLPRFRPPLRAHPEVLALDTYRLRAPTSRNANIKTQCLRGFQRGDFGSPNRLYEPIAAAHHVPARFAAILGPAAWHSRRAVGALRILAHRQFRPTLPPYPRVPPANAF